MINSLSISAIPGMREAIHKARAEQMQRREAAMLCLNHDLCGVNVRTMTVLDYVCLDRYKSPFLYHQEPTMEELSFFLWVLSPEHGKWVNNTGWRRFFGWGEAISSYLFGRKIRRKYGRNIPQTSEPLVIQCFKYIDEIFFDSPPALKASKKAGESCLSYLPSWFDQLQSEYHLQTDQIWQMGLPELFQRLNAIRQRNNPDVPVFNKLEDNVKAFVLIGLRRGQFTLDDLAANKVQFPENIYRN